MGDAVSDDSSAGDQTRFTSVVGEFGASQGDRPRAITMSIDPPDRAPVATPFESLELGDELEGDISRMSADGRGRLERTDELDDRRVRCRQVSFGEGAEVLHVGDLDDRGLRSPVEVGTVGQQGVGHHLDRRSMLDLVLLAAQESLGEGGIPIRVAGGAGGARERVRPNDRPVDLDEQLG